MGDITGLTASQCMQTEWLPKGRVSQADLGSTVYAQELLIRGYMRPLIEQLGGLLGKVKELVTAIAMERISGDDAAAQLEDLLNSRHAC